MNAHRSEFDPEHGSDYLGDYHAERASLDASVFQSWGSKPDHIHAPEVPESPSCGPGKHHIEMVPVCFDCGAVFGADHE